MTVHISSGAVVYRLSENQTPEILIMHRKDGGTWHLPKGTQAPGETLEETALREVLEESGVEINLLQHIGVLPSEFMRDGVTIKKETHYFLAEPKSISETHDQEHDEITFVELDKAIDLLKQHTIYEKEWEILEKALLRIMNADEVTD